MNKYLNQDELIDRLSDYAGENYYNRNARFGGEVDEFDYLFKSLAREEAKKLTEAERFDEDHLKD
jgi:deoxyribodipyrimidine photolyase-like uncharacterized protein